METSQPSKGIVPRFSDGEVQSINGILLIDRHAGWEDRLSTAPQTLCSMGICVFIAWCSKAEKFVQKGDLKLSKYLRTNLVDCSNRGREAFREAESGVYKISINIRTITEAGGALYNMQEDLHEGRLLASELDEGIGSIQQLTRECVTSMDSVLEKFEIWNQLISRVEKAYRTLNDSEYVVPWSRLIELFSRFLLNLCRITKSRKQDPDQVVETNEGIENPQKIVQETQNEIIGELENINPEEKAGDDIASALQEYLKNQTKLMETCGTLREFFIILRTVVESVAQDLEAGKDDPLSREQINGLRSLVATLEVYYTIAGNICSTYLEISRRYITPGINKVESLSRTTVNPEDIEEMRKSIVQYAKEAQSEIKAFANNRSNFLRDRLVDSSRNFEEIDDIN